MLLSEKKKSAIEYVFFKNDFKDQCQMLSLIQKRNFVRISHQHTVMLSANWHESCSVRIATTTKKNTYCQRASQLSREQTSVCFCFCQSEQIIEFNSSFLLSFSHFSYLDTRYYWVWHISTNMAVFFASVSQISHVSVATLCGLTSEGNHAFYWTASSG